MTPTPQLSHADRRAQLDALMANYSGPITHIETSANVYCPSCHHRERVRITGLDNNLRCSKCGRPDPLVRGRDATRQWTQRQRGR
jgi:hypothetical protein